MPIEPTPLPDWDERCPWWTEEAEAIGLALEGEHRADCTVVGGGYTGLACARRLAALRPDWRIAVVEALAIGQGSAGRNSGFVVDVGHWLPPLGREGNTALVHLARHGIAMLCEAGADRTWAEAGRFHVAVGSAGSRELARFRAGLDAMDEAYDVWSPDELAEAIGTGYYTEALRLPGGALVQPARLVRSFAESLPESVSVHEHSPVVRIESGPPHRVISERGQIDSAHLVVATNGFCRAFGIEGVRVAPLLTFASVTAPLSEPPGELAQWGVVPEHRFGSTLRLTEDLRILVRNGVRYHPRGTLRDVSHDAIRAVHRTSLRRRFPELDARLTHTWCGVLGVTLNGGTAYGSFGDEAWVCAGHNGVGIALGVALGDTLAHEVTGEDHGLDTQLSRLPRPAWLPPRALQAIGLPLYTGLLQRLAGAER